MKNLLKSIIFCLILIPFLSSCGVVYSVLLGVDTTPNWKSDKEISKQAKRYKIPDEYNLTLDTAAYYTGLSEIYSSREKELTIIETDSSEYFAFKRVLKDDTQPTQFRLFDKNGIEIFKIVNCYIDPPIPMNWNIKGCFDTFPPSLDIVSLNTHNYDLNFLLKSSSRSDDTKIALIDLPQSDYYGVILWNDFFRRPSRKLIKTVRKFIEDSDQSVHLIFIHNQNAYLWQVMGSEAQEKVKNALQ
ncbi:MAG: hypothetical protein PHW82_03625 [Bacteroidales bacterium]|nr:hypothetical protein [Bacteroidales bacterium]